MFDSHAVIKLPKEMRQLDKFIEQLNRARSFESLFDNPFGAQNPRILGDCLNPVVVVVVAVTR